MIVRTQNTSSVSTNSPVIVALDYHDITKALSFVDNISPQDCRLKVGMQMFTLYGPQFIQTLHNRGFQIFLDLKFHDIPNTVAQAVRAAAEMGVWMVNVHACGGARMMMAAKEALVEYGKDAPWLIAVTVLTSMEQADLDQVGIKQPPADRALQLAKLVKQCGVDGVVCSAHEALTLKSACGNDFLLVTPGIRPTGAQAGDQRRIMTPEQAINVGVDYMVIGRPITHSADPALTLAQINRSIGCVK
ncbi:orotidine-5'-phosphate decarboxylase [Arsenophonus apicola]|uniref:Orotidine 5'-phosphate decarboxylase n=1 Tax=Arsenophonus apicola TaxID=2879119 RepID=A0ABY8NYT0_9GAMM|nr:orotidine-5'-phosphate decarboxylase [Arsenophonus apicola]WGO82405.1 orotidine-5'-phosphate decarboxylase [Arsenophonus apicola]